MLSDFLVKQDLSLIGLLLFVSLVVAKEAGYRIGRRIAKGRHASEKRETGPAIVTTAILGLLAFMLAISLSMANERFNARRSLVLAEANAIGTAHLRAKAVGGPHGEEIARLLVEYTRLRLEYYEAGEDRKLLDTVYERTAQLQKRMWDNATAITAAGPTPINSILLQSLNQVIDLYTSRRWALEVRVPIHVTRLLILISLLATGMMGYHFGLCGFRHFVLSSLLCLALTASMILIMDMDRPRSGRIQPEQSPLAWTLESLAGSGPAAAPGR